MTTKTPQRPALGEHGEAVPRPQDEPIFTTLAAHWAAAGRLVPGTTAPEWETLTGRNTDDR
ncbi:hypothetical protein ACFYW6_37250 [Streptomyces sp. NPDC002659]|uniref:hypothetical protein n=1 Tax=Streptomyces sp. NPDC002659 TaxID=3364656 RepID=UPI0036A47346